MSGKAQLSGRHREKIKSQPIHRYLSKKRKALPHLTWQPGLLINLDCAAGQREDEDVDLWEGRWGFVRMEVEILKEKDEKENEEKD